MKIELVKFGEFLMSRPSGHEAALIICSQFLSENSDETIELDFTGVKATGPSWIHEVVLGIRRKSNNKITVIDAGNASVIESLKFVDLKS